MLTCKRIKVVLADEQDCFKKGLKISLEKCSKIDIVGEAITEDELIKVIYEKLPDIVLIDVHISNMDCVEFIRRYSQQFSTVQFIILSQNESEGLIASALSAGASGYLTKDAASCEILSAIEQVTSGHSYYSKRIASKIFTLFAENDEVRMLRRKRPFTIVEQAIIEGICNEMTNREIAEKLFLSVRTVEGHRLHILRKTKTKGTAGIVIYAIKHGLYKIGWQLSSRTT